MSTSPVRSRAFRIAKEFRALKSFDKVSSPRFEQGFLFGNKYYSIEIGYHAAGMRDMEWYYIDVKGPGAGDVHVRGSHDGMVRDIRQLAARIK